MESPESGQQLSKLPSYSFVVFPTMREHVYRVFAVTDADACITARRNPTQAHRRLLNPKSAQLTLAQRCAITRNTRQLGKQDNENYRSGCRAAHEVA
jgi:hypothetical protein